MCGDSDKNHHSAYILTYHWMPVIGYSEKVINQYTGYKMFIFNSIAVYGGIIGKLIIFIYCLI